MRTVRFGHPAARDLVALLPRTIVVARSARSRSPEADSMHSTLRLIAAEGRELRPGGKAVITRLSDVLVIQAVRTWIAGDPRGRPAGSEPCRIRASAGPCRWCTATLLNPGRWRRCARETAMSRAEFADPVPPSWSASR